MLVSKFYLYLRESSRSPFTKAIENAKRGRRSHRTRLLPGWSPAAEPQQGRTAEAEATAPAENVVPKNFKRTCTSPEV